MAYIPQPARHDRDSIQIPIKISESLILESLALNYMPLSDMMRIWFPSIVFVNTPGNLFSKMDENTENFAVRNGTFRYATIDEASDIMVVQHFAEKFIFEQGAKLFFRSMKVARTQCIPRENTRLHLPANSG